MPIGHAREKLQRRCQRIIGSTEHVEVAFVIGQRWGMLSRFSILAVTDDAVLIFTSSIWSNFVPRSIRYRGPRRRWTSNLDARVWGSIVVDRRYIVHRRWFGDVRAAEALLDDESTS